MESPTMPLVHRLATEQTATNPTIKPSPMILNLQNIGFGFMSEKPLFKNLCFGLEPGKIYALMGANGAGKTTLFNLITGFHRPASGSIHFQQQPITGLAPYKINRMGIGRTFQDLRLISKLTVKENILPAMPDNPTDHWINALLPEVTFKKQIQQLERNAQKIIGDYFLQDVQNAMADEISFGQQKLLNLACCVANQAQLLLLDEPVAGISPHYRELCPTLSSFNRMTGFGLNRRRSIFWR